MDYAISELMDRVATEIERRGLELKGAARAIGVGAKTLSNHLAGEHVRSDSARKYSDWLEGRAASRNVFVLPFRAAGPAAFEERAEPEAQLPVPVRPRLVVDIFSGCGGLSLGFDLLGGGRQFRTILAIDNQQAPIDVLNVNARLLGHGNGTIGRQVDLTDFLDGAEFLAFYVDHVASALQDAALSRDLRTLHDGIFSTFLASVAAADEEYIETVNSIRCGQSWRNAFAQLDRQSLSQTSVIAFHEKLKLPRSSTRQADLPPLLWGRASVPSKESITPASELIAVATAEWDEAVAELASKRGASGRGQLAASARRVSAFVEFIRGAPSEPLRRAWIDWRATRLGLRAALFTEPSFVADLKDLYFTRCRASVLVGGPPCQGFSRIGRGKIRSLREAQVHVHGNSEAGDARNLLFQQYIMVLEALRPEVFLFENVQHFQSKVMADGVEFDATQVLAEAIASMSEYEARYEVASNVLDASQHGVPQARQRYFMAGVLANGVLDAGALARSCLKLRRVPEVPLAAALVGLPQPEAAGGDRKAGGMNLAVRVHGPHPEDGALAAWLRQPCPASGKTPLDVDGHAARTPRTDDASLFALMGPGKRWMDYRADDAETTAELQGLIDALLSLPAAKLGAIASSVAISSASKLTREGLVKLRQKVDGSLPLRLILEQSAHRLGSPHHLLTDSYLAKRDGNHGDWVARMDGSRPSKTMVSHMGKDTYAYVHPQEPRTISVREAARVQTFPDWFTLRGLALTDGFKMIGNAVPPLLSHAIAAKVAAVLHRLESPSCVVTQRNAHL